MNIVAIDPSLKFTGIYSVVDGRISTGVFSPHFKDRYQNLGEMLAYFLQFARGGFGLCIIEGYDPSAKGYQAQAQGEVGGIIRGCFAARGVPIIEVGIQTWKAVTGISRKKATSMEVSEYLNEVSARFHRRFETTHEADAFLMYQTVKTCCTQIKTLEGSVKIRQRLDELKIREKDFN